MELLLLAFLAGALTVLSPCVLPVLPVVLAGSTNTKDRKAPFFIIGSLLLSVFAFTMLLKGSTTLIGVPTSFWLAFSGILVIAVGFSFLFPESWDKIALKIGLGSLSTKINKSASETKSPRIKQVLLGLSLGPIFTSCSPTYGIILATILPASLLQGTIYIVFYILGLSFVLLLIAIGGQSVIRRLGWAAKPSGSFRKGMAILLIVTGLLIATGFIKTVETWLVDRGFLGLSSLEENFTGSFDKRDNKTTNSEVTIPSHLRSAFSKTDWKKADPSISSVISGGPGKDGIPSIDDPKFVSVKDSPEQGAVQVIVLEDGNSHKVYPYSILNWHEIVNDTVNGVAVAVTFCPLCGSAIVFDRTLPDGSKSTFGVSGSLLESNMIMYDRETETLWQQSTGLALAGKHLDTKLDLVSFQLLTMKEVRERLPNAAVLSRDTNHRRDYDDNPYAGYETSESFYFSPSITDSRYPAKAIFVAFSVNEKPVAMPFLSLKNGESYQTTVHSQDITVKKKDGEVFIEGPGNVPIPFYFEMWFSWATQNTQNAVVFNPSKQ